LLEAFFITGRRNMKALISTLLLTSIGLSVAGSAFALPQVYKVVNGVTAKVFVTEQTANTELQALLDNAPKTRTLTYNNCGWGKFKESTTSPVVRFTKALSFGAMFIGDGADPVCTKDAQGVYTSTNDGLVGMTVRRSNGFIWYKGSSTLGAGVVYVTNQSVRKAKVNACGLASFSVPVSNVVPFKFTIPTSTNLAGTVFNVSSLTARTYPHACRKVGTSYVLYRPSGIYAF